MAPASPPAKLVIPRGIRMRLGMFSFCGYAPPLAVVPTTKASVFVAFAGIGGTPVNRSAGKAIKLPPPATAFMPPPRAPARNRKIALYRFKESLYHDFQFILQLTKTTN